VLRVLGRSSLPIEEWNIAALSDLAAATPVDVQTVMHTYKSWQTPLASVVIFNECQIANALCEA
jgi:hypothetical protein